MATLNVHFLPELVSPDDLADSTCVVIDVLRATTTIAYALAAGAREVIPCLTIDDARAAAARLPKGEVLLGGERGGVRIEGFDLGNSPDEFSAERVAGKTIVFTTTNGTKAMLHCRRARRVLLGSFVNLSAIAARIADAPQLDLICSGTEGKITREDVLLAGAVADRLPGDRELNDQAAIARGAWRESVGAKLGAPGVSERVLIEALRASRGGRNLIRLKLERDIEQAARLDRFDLLPRFDPALGRIVVV